MSIGVGTLKPKTRIMRPVWLAGLLVVMAFTSAVVIANSEDRTAPAVTAVSRPLVNTPSELSGGIASSTLGGTVANTPTELSGGLPTEFSGTGDVPNVVPHVPKRAPADDGPDALGGNTPSEIGGRVDLCQHQCT